MTWASKESQIEEPANNMGRVAVEVWGVTSTDLTKMGDNDDQGLG